MKIERKHLIEQGISDGHLIEIDNEDIHEQFKAFFLIKEKALYKNEFLNYIQNMELEETIFGYVDKNAADRYINDLIEK